MAAGLAGGRCRAGRAARSLGAVLIAVRARQPEWRTPPSAELPTGTVMLSSFLHNDLHFIIGSARGCPGSTCISPGVIYIYIYLSLSLSVAAKV